MRRPLKTETFAKLKALNVPIGSVIDVGVRIATWELMSAFPDKKHLLIEPVEEWNDQIHKTYTARGIDYDLVNVAASNEDGAMAMEITSVRPGVPITHARITDKPRPGASVREVEVRTLDSLLTLRWIPKPYLLKIDVDGVELLVLEGAEKTLENTNIVVIEANIQNFIERAAALQKAGFEIFDFVDPCYYDGRLRQFDLVFLNSKMVQERNLDMYKQPFDVAKWENYK